MKTKDKIININNITKYKNDIENLYNDGIKIINNLKNNNYINKIYYEIMNTILRMFKTQEDLICNISIKHNKEKHK